MVKLWTTQRLHDAIMSTKEHLTLRYELHWRSMSVNAIGPRQISHELSDELHYLI